LDLLAVSTINLFCIVRSKEKREDAGDISRTEHIAENMLAFCTLGMTRQLWKKIVEDQRLIALEAFSEVFD